MKLRSLAVLALTATTCAGCAQQRIEHRDSPTKITFGMRQVEQMLDDRPEMRDSVPASHPVYAWVVEGFDGKRLGQRVYWNANTPRSGRHAEHALPYRGYPGQILVSGGSETTPIDKWAAIVYELNNIQNHEAFLRLRDQAIAGEIDGDGFAAECVELEFRALEETQKFFRQNPLPTSSHGQDAWYNFAMSDSRTFTDYERRLADPFSRRSVGNFTYFREYYEQIMQAQAKRAGRSE